MQIKFFLLFFTGLILASRAPAEETSALPLKDYLEQLESSSDNVNAVLIPFDRSPEGQLTDFKNPRVIISFGQDSEKNIKEFMAYSKNETKLQSIRWNEDSRSYDFLVDPNYNGQGPPHLQKADSRSCTQCHQNGGPLFTRGTWSEINESDPRFTPLNSGENIVRRIRVAVGADQYLGFGVGISGFGMEARTSAAALFNQSVQICNQACGPDKNCRRALLETAVNKKRLSQTFLEAANGVSATILRIDKKSSPPPAAFKKIEDQWPADGYAFPDWSLVDRPGLAKYDSTQANENLNPRTPRKRIHGIEKTEAAIYLEEVAADCLGLTQSDLDAIAKIPKEKMQPLLYSMQALDLIAQWPPTRKKILALLGSDKDKSVDSAMEPPTTEKNDPSSQNPGQKFTETEIKNRRPVGIEHFQFYCARCHLEGRDAPRFPLSSEARLKKYMQAKGNQSKFVQQLKDGDMPSRGPIPPAELNNLMIEWLQKP